MAKLTDLTSGNYLKSADIGAQEVSVTLERIDAEKMPDQDGKVGDIKHVAYFVGKAKGIVLNKTNLNVLQEMGLEDTDVIPPNFAMILYTHQVPFNGQMVDSLILRANLGTAPGPVELGPLAQTLASTLLTPPIDDDVPF